MNTLQKMLLPSVIALVATAQTQAQTQSVQNPKLSALPDIIVTAEFREQTLQESAVSATVLSDTVIAQQSAQHLQQILGLAPNINFSSGASRGRFIQIRGIGERSQFVEPGNSAVGILIDGIDFTGISGAATTLDLQQVEILRGPQGTLFGANALAGLINLKSNAPSEIHTGKLAVTAGDYDTKVLSAVSSGPISDTLAYRIAAESHTSDGYINNTLLGRRDTSDYDEVTVRGSLSWAVSDELNVDFSLLNVDIDNGYDDFSLDNTRETLSDKPGHDRQRSTGWSIKSEWQGLDNVYLVGLLSHNQSELAYGYDEDWSHPGICDGLACDAANWGFDWWFVSFDNYLRDNSNSTLDLRLASKADNDGMAWTMGFYYRDQAVDLNRVYTYSADFISHFDTENTALYGQASHQLNDQLTLTGGLRVEKRSAEYSDNAGVSYQPDENLWGGKISLEYLNQQDQLIYALISRGYKAGGFNGDDSIPDSQREFDTEFMWNYEIGFKDSWNNNQIQMQAAAFYQQRDDIQVKQSIVNTNNGDLCPCDFTDFTDNAARGYNYGIEVAINIFLNENLSVFANIGLLETAYEDYLSYNHVDFDSDAEAPTPIDLDGRDQAHAPSYQFALGADFSFGEHGYGSVTLEGKDAFFFSSRHSVRSDAYELLNMRVGWREANWDFAVFARNLSDEDVKVRAFGSFGNDPRKFYETEPYYQLGEPRVVGASASYTF